MDKRVQKVLIIGSGPIVIGRSSEYDYCVTQACLALKEENIKVVVVNSNPSCVMTDKEMADAVYIEPLNVDIVKRVIELEQPDAILPTMGGDVAFDIALDLHQTGYLAKNRIALLTVSPDILDIFENAGTLREWLADIGEPTTAVEVVTSVEDAVMFAKTVGFPVIVKPAYALGGQETALCSDNNEVEQHCEEFLKISLIHQVAVEKCVHGWKQLEFELVRDRAGNSVCISSIENIDPYGIHTGDSVIVTPAQTLTDDELLRLRSSALNILSSLGIVGSCNIQFALKPDGSEYAVVAVDPKVGRSTAIVSKATGYTIARVAAKVAVGKLLYEIYSEITGVTTACHEPAVDYCCVKIPKWSFEKFDNADRRLKESMQSTGSVLCFGISFEAAFLKAVRSLNNEYITPSQPRFEAMTDEELSKVIKASDDERLFAVYEAVKRGVSAGTLCDLTHIDPWFISKLKNIAGIEHALSQTPDPETIERARRAGFLEASIFCNDSASAEEPKNQSYNMIDTCAAEYDAIHPYFYSAYGDEDETVLVPMPENISDNKVLVIGSGPSTVGFGAEQDYCNYYALKTLKATGFFTLCVNNNPDALTTDFRYTDRLYFEPVCAEDVADILNKEKPQAVLFQFAGEKASEMARLMKNKHVRVLGADADVFELLNSHEQLRECLIAVGVHYSKESFLNAVRMEADVISDGEESFIPGISEHIERSGIHAGDSISVCPPVSLNSVVLEKAADIAAKVAKSLKIKGIINLQLCLYDNRIYVTEISANSFHNIPFITKLTGIPVIEIAVRCMAGEKLETMGYKKNTRFSSKYYAVRVPVFSFDKLQGTDVQLGTEMKSTGEVFGIANRYEDALLKGLLASGMRIKRSGGVLVTVRDSDKHEAIVAADKFLQLDFNLYATAGTAKTLNAHHVPASSVRKLHEGSPHVLDMLNANKIDYVISTSEKALNALGDDIRIRRRAIEKQIPTFTVIETAAALAGCLAHKRSLEDIDLVDTTKL